MAGPRGRRPAGEDTRADILAAARAEFSRRGYEGASLRAIARAAGVDPKLVHHYFATKGELFGAMVDIPPDPHIFADTILFAPLEELGEMLVRLFVATWDPQAGRERFAAMFAAAAANEEQAEFVREFMRRAVFVNVMKRLEAEGLGGSVNGSPALPVRASLALSQLVGMGVLRYVVRQPTLAAMSEDELVASLAPIVQEHLVPRPPV
ncbi:TetR family transcriptional regulator [Knoellia remsis]|uniref:TetR family transcriptional regulator n=1 Tax=Knoellia remsis TaxID=407159 RepID=A0A2T0UN14_9MICO|nr:TetR family transcriptional regulator [Knoellia remsis]PRY59312.1 TetR family transcriptional regulator [Knoellia remsis]